MKTTLYVGAVSSAMSYLAWRETKKPNPSIHSGRKFEMKAALVAIICGAVILPLQI